MATENAIQPSPHQAVDVTRNPGVRRHSWTYRPSVDIFDTSEELLLMADMPGADPERVDVTLESGILTVQANVAPRQPDQAQCLVHEYGVGSFHRRFEIDESIDAEAVSAEYRDGALNIRLPKAQQARRRRIPVSS